jgi:anti-sigma regulatory factor (Ser/Thr protein kinase)
MDGNQAVVIILWPGRVARATVEAAEDRLQGGKGMNATDTPTTGASPVLIHQALIYDSDESFLSATLGFCRDGLDQGERVLAVTTAANLALLAEGLGDAADDMEFVTADAWYDAPGRTLTAYGRYVDVHKVRHGRVRIIGEPVWHGRSQAEESEWTRYESVINAAFADSPAWIVCPYDARVLPEQIVADARRTHPALLVGSGAQASPHYSEPDRFTCATDHLPLPPLPDAAVEIRFGADLAAMRRQVQAWAIAYELTGEQAERLLLAVNEVAANAVQHGAGHGRIRLWADKASIVCDVLDLGQLDHPYPGYLPPDPAAGRGHGLWVVRQLCDVLQIRAGEQGTQFRLHLARA